MERDRTRISLRIRHPSRTAAELCGALPFAPGRTWDVGAPRTDPRGTPRPGRYGESYATFPLSEGAGPPAEAVAATAERVAPYGERFLAWRAEGGTVEFFVGWFMEGGNAGDEFGPELLSRLGALGIGLSLDIYSGADA
ncbi:hypothetical protein MPPM_4257 [Methylorubrum populi]|uniref:DUF4279 domain-containing protein n=1 Tax=Methylorubrum populi TaxID=223967 RepID=A0A161JMW3_9HYPH|nr:hypothetical protein [Methylorubrum populi]BAU92862.1 hypothetical protein MPPM_4257 [Methylorubrum populi]